MARFNTITKAPAPVNHEGHKAYARSDKMELFLLAAGSYAEQGSFYESKDDRALRLRTLTQKVALKDPDWIKGFIPWLRSTLGMRTAAVVIAAEAAKAMVASGHPGSREIVASALWRADEPGELIAYWYNQHGRKLPKPVKRGVADAVKAKFNEKNYLKFDSDKNAIRFKDVLRIVHPDNQGPWQAALYDFITKGGEVRPELLTLQANAEVRRMAKIAPEAITPELISKAGLTWEDMPSLTGKPWRAEDWENVIPSMKYLATLRNLNNFSKANIGSDTVRVVREKLASAEDLRASKTGPLNLLAAIKNQTSATYLSSLGDALDNSVANIPKLKGKTIIYIDTSYSMMSGFSKRGEIKYWEAASLFGLALARACEKADVISFSDSWKEFPSKPGEDLQTAVKRFQTDYNMRGGTDLRRAMQATLKDQDRVIVLTDEQYNGHSYFAGRDQPTKLVGKGVKLHTYNLAGYSTGGMSEYQPNRFYSAGLNDRAFSMIPLMEELGGKWPWEN